MIQPSKVLHTLLLATRLTLLIQHNHNQVTRQHRLILQVKHSLQDRHTHQLPQQVSNLPLDLHHTQCPKVLVQL